MKFIITVVEMCLYNKIQSIQISHNNVTFIFCNKKISELKGANFL